MRQKFFCTPSSRSGMLILQAWCPARNIEICLEEASWKAGLVARMRIAQLLAGNYSCESVLPGSSLPFTSDRYALLQYKNASTCDSEGYLC